MYQAILNVRFECVVSELTIDNTIDASNAKMQKYPSQLRVFEGKDREEVVKQVVKFIEDVKNAEAN
jgi:hypothetical protein